MAYCRDSYGRTYYCNRGWYDYGRWAVLAIIIVAAFLLFFCCSCISQRRRRKAGRNPYYGTGWAQRLPYGNHGVAQYNPNYQQQNPNSQQNYQQAPAPNYNTGGYYAGGGGGGANQSYFGGQQTDVEMQRPDNTYRGGDNVYAPPPGPPPGKH